jgi:acetylornithine deacetylase/succinyl-diaminopimelate desuccinylase-like protein
MGTLTASVRLVARMVFALLLAQPAWAQSPDLSRALQDRAVQAAIDGARQREADTIERQVRICQVAAPPFAEGARGEMLRREFVSAGLSDVRVDRVGNVIGERPGTGSGPRVVLAAHLDTVFPADTDVRVRREGALLHGPGIGDNCRGLAVLVSVARLLDAMRVRTRGTIVLVANVGEEGLGDLRGVRALFDDTTAGRIDRFVSVDGPGLHITNVAVGSYRYRVTFTGPGGHSFGAFGLANPIHALGRAMAAIAEFTVPSEPRTTFNIGRVGGGTSVNAIAAEAWMEVDMRSSDPAALAVLDAGFHRAVDAAAADENARWGRPGVVSVATVRVGSRPGGVTAADSAIVRTARGAAEALGFSVALGEGSTDANLPISRGIPAITIGGGGRGSGAHALTESFDGTEAWRGTAHALLVAVALAYAETP